MTEDVTEERPKLDLPHPNPASAELFEDDVVGARVEFDVHNNPILILETRNRGDVEVPYSIPNIARLHSLGIEIKLRLPSGNPESDNVSLKNIVKAEILTVDDVPVEIVLHLKDGSKVVVKYTKANEKALIGLGYTLTKRAKPKPPKPPKP